MLQKVKVVHLITELSIGGAQQALYRLLANMERERFEIQALCLYNGDKAIARQIQALGIAVIDLKMARKWRVDSLWRLFLWLRRAQPEILHTWMFHANIPGRLVGKLAGVPIIVSSERTMGQEGKFRQRLNKLTSSLADRVTCVSQQVARYAENEIGIDPEKILVVPNGIDLTQFEKLPSQKQARALFDLPQTGPLVGAVGRPRPVKGYGYLLEAWSRLAAIYPDGRLIFVGDGPDRQVLQERASHLGIERQVIFLDDQLNIPQLLPALDILALPSLHEGMPNVVLEAMAASVPVVATAVGGTPEVVADGETGLLVSPRSAAALAGALTTLIDDPERMKLMGGAGRQRILQDFNLTQTVRLTESLYDEMLRKKRQLRYESGQGWVLI